MASLGTLEVAIEANTEGLKKATGAINRLNGQMLNVANTMERSARRFESAAEKMEKSLQSVNKTATATAASTRKVRSATQATGSQMDKQRRIVAQLEKQYRAQRAELVKIQRAGVDTSTAQRSLATQFGRTRKELENNIVSNQRATQLQDRFRTSLLKTERQYGSFAKSLRSRNAFPQIVQLSQNAQRGLRGFGGSLRQAASRAEGYSKAVENSSQRSRKFKQATAQATDSLSALSRSARLLEGPLGGIAARLQTLTEAFRKGEISALALGTAIAGLGAGFGLLSAAIIRNERQFQKIENALGVAANNAAEAANTFNFVKDAAIELGLNLSVTADQFAQLAAAAKGTSLEGRVSREVFLGVTAASRALGLTAQETGGALRALQQMISKGNVQAEELRGQLGERIPGAFRQAADAMGVTTAELNKMLEQGQVLATDLLPKLAEEWLDRFAGPAQKASMELEGSINRLQTEVQLLLRNIDDATGISRKFTDILNSINEALRSINENQRAIESAANAFQALFTALTTAGGLLLGGVLAKAFKALAASIAAAAASATSLRAALLAVFRIGPAALIGILAGAVSFLSERYLRAGDAARRNAEALEEYRSVLGPAESDSSNFADSLSEQATAAKQARERLRELGEERIRQTKESLERLRDQQNISGILDATSRVLPTGGIAKRILGIKDEEELGKAIQKLEEDLKQFEERGEQLENFSAIVWSSQLIDSADKASNSIDKLTDEFKELVAEAENVERRMKALSEGGLEALERLNQRISGESTADSIMESILGSDQTQEVLRDTKLRLEELADTIPSVTDAMSEQENLSSKVRAGLEAYSIAVERNVDAQKQYQQVLEDIQTPQEKLAQKQKMLNRLVEQTPLTTQEAEEAMEQYRQKLVDTEESTSKLVQSSKELANEIQTIADTALERFEGSLGGISDLADNIGSTGSGLSGVAQGVLGDVKQAQDSIDGLSAAYDRVNQRVLQLRDNLAKTQPGSEEFQDVREQLVTALEERQELQKQVTQGQKDLNAVTSNASEVVNALTSKFQENNAEQQRSIQNQRELIQARINGNAADVEQLQNLQQKTREFRNQTEELVVSEETISKLRKENESLANAVERVSITQAEANRRVQEFSRLLQEDLRAQAIQDLSESMAQAFVDPLTDAIMEAKSFSDVIDSIERQLLKIAAQEFFTKPLQQLFSNAIGTGLNQAAGPQAGTPNGSGILVSAASNLFGFAGSAGGGGGGNSAFLKSGAGANMLSGGPSFSGGGGAAGGGFFGGLFGFQSGGQFTVGSNLPRANTGSQDNRIAPLALSQGERVTIETPAQQRQTPEEAGTFNNQNFNLTFNVNANDANSFRKSRDQIAKDVGVAVSRAAKRNG